MNDTQTIDVLKALADETRLSLVRKLAAQAEPIASCDLVSSCASLMKLSQPAMSHHFTNLVDADVLREEKHGTAKQYALNHELLASVGIDISKL